MEGGYDARALGYSIYTQGQNWDDLKEMARDAVLCHFDEDGFLYCAVACLVAAFLGGAVPAVAQTAVLERVEAADVDASRPFHADDAGRMGEAVATGEPTRPGALGDQSRTPCLAAGWFVLVVQRYAGSVIAGAGIGRNDDDLTAVSVWAEDEQNASAWTAVNLETSGCLRLTVFGGRARLYRLRVNLD